MSASSGCHGRSAGSSRSGAATGIPAALRHAVRKLEGRPDLLTDPAGLVAFGIPEVDAVLGGGLARAALHEIVAGAETQAPSASGFALALAGRAAGAGTVLWIAEDMTRLESGAPYGPGLDEIGLLPEAVLTVAAAHPREVLWAMEEALRCRAVGAVVGEVRKPGAVDLVASRRLSLAATRERRIALLVRASPPPRPAAAATRWMVSAASSATAVSSGPGPPAFALHLVRNRQGRLGTWTLEWNRAAQCFRLPSTHPQPVAVPVADEPDRTAVA